MWTETLTPIENPDAVDERARDLEAANLNGLAAALMSFDPPAGPSQARMELHFINALHVADILAGIAGGTDPAAVFSIRGGHRLPAGPAAGQVRCVGVSAGPLPRALVLVIEPVGDYSTYGLECLFDPARIDPFFADLRFKFRPGCFSNNCSPDWAKPRAPLPVPAIDYLAKDFDSFRHVMFTAMADRVPGWQPTSEADFDQVLISLFAAAADELSDYQDRVMAEAYLATARSRVSLARHARLMDYHIHQGQQATTWARLTVAGGTAPFVLPEELVAWTGGGQAEGDPVVFATRETEVPAAERTLLHPGFNRFRLHTWAGAEAALPAGTSGADVVPVAGITANELRDAVNDGRLAQLLIAEELNPLTGATAGFDRRARQVLRLLPEALTLHDPLLGIDLVRVKWSKADALRRAYCFRALCPTGPVDDISAFSGNLVMLHQGLPVVTHFHEPGADLPEDGPTEFHRHYRTQSLYGEARAVLADLPHEALPLAYRTLTPGGAVAPRSSLRVLVEEPGGATDKWDEVPSLVHSDDSAENGDHYAVETDERQQSRLRFGNGVNGRLLPAGAVVHAHYQVGGGVAGNVGADAVASFAPLSGLLSVAIEALTNPFDVTDGLRPGTPGADPPQRAGGLPCAPASRGDARRLHRPHRGGTGRRPRRRLLCLDRIMAHRPAGGRPRGAHRSAAPSGRDGSGRHRATAPDRRGHRDPGTSLRAADGRGRAVPGASYLARGPACGAGAGVFRRPYARWPDGLFPPRRVDLWPGDPPRPDRRADRRDPGRFPHRLDLDAPVRCRDDRRPTGRKDRHELRRDRAGHERSRPDGTRLDHVRSERRSTMRRARHG
jgi:hypothetical protein